MNRILHLLHETKVRLTWSRQQQAHLASNYNRWQRDFLYWKLLSYNFRKENNYSLGNYCSRI